MTKTIILNHKWNIHSVAFVSFISLVYPFPTYNKYAADNLENILAKSWEIFINKDTINDKSWKHCGKRRNCSFMSNFFYCYNVFKSRLLQRHQKASICGKGIQLVQSHNHITNFNIPTGFIFCQICQMIFAKYTLDFSFKQYFCWFFSNVQKSSIK